MKATVFCFLAFLAGVGCMYRWRGDRNPEVVTGPENSRTGVDLVAEIAKPMRTEEAPPEAHAEREGPPYESVTIPRVMLRYYSGPGAFMGLRAVMSSSYADELGLVGSEIGKIEAATKRVLEALANLEVERAEVRQADAGGEYFFIPPLGEAGEEIFESFSEELGTFLDEGRRIILLESAKRSDAFSRFGETSQELSITERPDQNGDPLYFFEHRFRSRSGSSGGSETRINSMNEITARYPGLFPPSTEREE